ncbi:hypothetical protein SPRG_14244 [Saprolegnia parasitica CBS 223.65]|uniref:Uncharacterized protein n=1 Tax=Saprolegnia parasitica (strain CBS 223.65) TaxID=695850 RepID=A0A067BYV1_SAPPC|nr:hypothetical protein SPRG_14244 [Saprolegnia parasitica CBS 223.65]KDO19717.1 hypothetical protein SPRG_14244 [Saprolegnia parasitica CBS 223.65]|eukprot:XP_012209576.1 hypothetical protein SPRG_14244 [Saprolegnia parasitica CBS 223.65]
MVLEAKADGSFDVDAAGDDWEALKAEGNGLFAQKDYVAAIDVYARALAAAPTDQQHLVLGNRSSCFFQLQRYSDALADANAALALQPQWEKGRARKQCILKAMAAAKAAKVTTTANALRGLYVEKDPVVPDEDATKPAQMLWRRLKQSLASQHQGCLDGIFAKLSNERDFVQLVYPGISAEDIQRQQLPRSLRQLLSDAATYESELIALMPKVEAKANLVLANVKAKGAAQGEIMDAATEAVLRPQVFNEAFARELLSMIQRVNTQKHALLAQDARFLANPDAECAHLARIDDVVGDRLFRSCSVPCGVLDGFMGDEYIPFLRSDALRLRKQGKLLPVGPHAMRFWTTESSLNEDFPALADVVEKLHMLPFALNRQFDLRLCDETKMEVACSTSLVCLETGQSQPRRLDCGPHGDPNDNGYKLTCVYCLGGDENALGGDLEVTPLSSGVPTVVAAKTDRLWLFKSQEPDVYMVFRIHGMVPLSP